LRRRGCLKIIYKNGQRFLKLTKKGELEALMAKVKGKVPEKAWDGKWRLIVFDIPEQAREKRDKLRFLLKQAGFKKLQASVFISPYALNREAVEYLKQTGLTAFIRILKVEEIDDDKDLKKQFKIS
jgi:phenylacetic acid degradation operon negative regulatory protein